jgi:hypothetical protein
MAAKLLVTRVRRRQKRKRKFAVGWSSNKHPRVVRNEQQTRDERGCEVDPPSECECDSDSSDPAGTRHPWPYDPRHLDGTGTGPPLALTPGTSSLAHAARVEGRGRGGGEGAELNLALQSVCVP